MNILFLINLLAALMSVTVLIWKRHWVLALVACLSVLIYGYGLFFHGVPSHETLIHMLYCEERYSPDKAIASSYGAMVCLITTSLMMTVFPWLKRRTLFVWFGLLMIIGAVTGLLSPLGVFEGFYGICCAIMTILSQMLGLSYLQTCCLENIYIHSLLPTLFAFPAAFVGARNMLKRQMDSVFASLLSILNFLLCASTTIIIWNHYIHHSMLQASQLCVEELQMMGRILLGRGWAGYVMANMIIFVGFFLASALVSWLLYRWTKHYNKNI